MGRTFDVYGIGNALVDVQYEVTPEFLARLGIAKGLMTLVDEARQRELTRALRAAPVKRSSGGSAANTVVAVAQLGGTAAYGCKVARDDLGEFFVADMQAAGVACDPARSPWGITGQCLVLITPDADRTMNTFLGITGDFGPDDVDEAKVAASEHLYIEGYLLGSPSGLEAALAAQRLARRHGTRVALTLSDPSVVAAFRGSMARLIDAGVDLLFCNEAEARAYTGAPTTAAALDALADLVPRAAVTCGADGALIRDGDRRLAIPGFPAAAVDTNGAGDMFAGAFLYGVTHGHDVAAAGKLAAYAASRVVAQRGPRLSEPLRGQVDRILAL
jgi:fructokinase